LKKLRFSPLRLIPLGSKVIAKDEVFLPLRFIYKVNKRKAVNETFLKKASLEFPRNLQNVFAVTQNDLFVV